MHRIPSAIKLISVESDSVSCGIAAITLSSHSSMQKVRAICRSLLRCLLPAAVAPAFFATMAVAAEPAVTPASQPAAGDHVSFDRQVQPILSDKCYFCHGPDAQRRKARLRLDTPEGAYKGDAGDAAIVPGKPDASELVSRIFSKDPDELMPPPDSHRTLTDGEKQILQKWIEQGATYTRHWSFVAPVKPPLPELADESPRDGAPGPQSPIDRYVYAHLQKEGLAPSPQADRPTLIRRVTLDLTGLPPTPQEVADFVADTTADAYKKVVDRLLASPAFGERMAWDWLDAARYADSNGYQGDSERTMWPWRDWVVDAFNQNLPYDQFTIQQLAGDLLPKAADEKATTRQVLATAFCRNHAINGEGGRIAEENRVEYIFDQLETTATVWLGLTFNCTRCHDHKFDALTQRDYYGLYAFFNQTPVTGAGRDPQTVPRLDMISEEVKTKLAEMNAGVTKSGKAIDELERKIFPRPAGKTTADSERASRLSKLPSRQLKATAAKRNDATLEQLADEFRTLEPEYASQLDALRKLVAARDEYSVNAVRVMVMQDMPKPRQTYILDHGIYDKSTGVEVTAATPGALPSMASGDPVNRLGLARWIVSDANPLTARVTVNHFWQHFFGVGLVKTPEDFGVQGERPQYQDLLDWLAVDFRESGWDVKRLCRAIVTSGTYRQTSKVSTALVERDPENRLLGRGPRFRMPAWMLRDQALAVSGLLVEKVGGPPVRPYQPEGVWEEASFGTKKYVQDHGDSLYRRSLYTFWRRIAAPTMFFDNASRQTCTVKVTRTNSPLHALTTLNDEQFVEAARVLAQRVLTRADSSSKERVALAFRLVLSRQPNDGELNVLVSAADRLTAEYRVDEAAAKKLLAVGESPRDGSIDPVDHAAYTALCLSILNLDEAVTKE